MGKKLADEGDEVRIKVIWPDSCASCSELSGVTLTTPQSTIVNHYQPFLITINHYYQRVRFMWCIFISGTAAGTSADCRTWSRKMAGHFLFNWRPHVGMEGFCFF